MKLELLVHCFLFCFTIEQCFYVRCHRSRLSLSFDLLSTMGLWFAETNALAQDMYDYTGANVGNE